MKKIPFPTKLPESTVTRAEALAAFDRLREATVDVPEMSTEEIDEEIAAVRAEHKKGTEGLPV